MPKRPKLLKIGNAHSVLLEHPNLYKNVSVHVGANFWANVPCSLLNADVLSVVTAGIFSANYTMVSD